jgi:ATP-dependent RNA helicase HelY
MLAGLYHEADLLIGETLRAGLFNGLEPAELAAVVSSFCFEARREREGALQPPPGVIADTVDAIAELSEGLGESERALALPVTRGVDGGFAVLARDWGRGRDLRRVLEPGSDRGSGGRHGRSFRRVMTGGDFVRNMKQVIDLLRQLAEVAPDPSVRSAAAAAATRLKRGVVAASSAVTVEEPDGSIHAVGTAAS